MGRPGTGAETRPERALGVEAGEPRDRGEPVVAASWQRCQTFGPDPAADPPRVLGDDELTERCATHPLAEVLPWCRELLAAAVHDSRSVFAVADATGALLWVEGEPGARRRTERMGFAPGTDWSERSAGTNAPGTALLLDAPVAVRGREHFLEAVKPWSCSAAPVHDPDGGAAIGVIDITGGVDVAGPHALALVRATASAVQAELGRRVAAADVRALDSYRQGPGRRPGTALVSRGGRVLDRRGPAAVPVDLGAADGLVVLPDGRRLELEPWGPDGHVVARLVSRTPEPARAATLAVLGRDCAVLDVDGRQVRLTPRQSEIVWLLSRAADGMSAARLAVHLSDSEVATGTIRVDMSRLRDVLGETMLGSMPYRLLRSVRTDDADVRDLLGAGRVGEALARYRGPLLPVSDSPTVVEQRGSLEVALRAAVLASGDPALVGAWVASTWADDDTAAWRSLAGLLPAGSPQQAAAAAHARPARPAHPTPWGPATPR